MRRFSNATVVRGDALARQHYTESDVILAHQFFHCLIGDDRLSWLRLCAGALSARQGSLMLSSMVGLPESLPGGIDPVTRINRPGNRYYAELEEIEQELSTAGFVVRTVIRPLEHDAIFVAEFA